jgi:hypothetical protein
MRPHLPWLLPNDEPVLALLIDQWTTVSSALDAVTAWAHGAMETAGARAVLEAATDREREERRTLHRRVRTAFWTPLDPEDVYELGERIGMLLRQLDLLVGEADAAGVAPDSGLAGILSGVTSAAETLALVFRTLPDGDAARLADDAADRLEAADAAYASALASMPRDDREHEIGRRALYQRGERITEAATRVAHRAWYSVCKIS